MKPCPTTANGRLPSIKRIGQGSWNLSTRSREASAVKLCGKQIPRVENAMQVNFLFNEKPVEVDRFRALVKAEPDQDIEMERNAIRVAALTRMGINAPEDLPVIYAPEKA